MIPAPPQKVDEAPHKACRVFPQGLQDNHTAPTALCAATQGTRHIRHDSKGRFQDCTQETLPKKLHLLGLV